MRRFANSFIWGVSVRCEHVYTPRMGSYSTILFARPSFLSGVARTLDVGATFNEYNSCASEAAADSAALAADWLAVGEDLMHSARAWAREHGVEA
jgi:hypothetical protein